QVYCPKHVKDVKSCLDVEGRDSQIGPVSYQEARDRILPKLLMGYMSAAAVGNSKSGKNGRAPGKDAKSKESKKRARENMGITDIQAGADARPDQYQTLAPQVLGRKRRRTFGPDPTAPLEELGEPECVDRVNALIGPKVDTDVDENGALVLHTFW
ncbi:unnamed protein product, partial [Laminaria digitata]